MIASDVKDFCNGVVEVINNLEVSSQQATTSAQTLSGQLDLAKTEITQLQSLLAKKTIVFDACDKQPWIVAGGTVANTGQTGSTAADAQGQPTFNSAAFFRIMPNGPWADKYWYQQKGPFPTFDTYKYELDILFADQVNSNAANCVELDIQQVISGQVFNTGLQLNFSGNQLRIWDRSAATPTNTGLGGWRPSGVACPRLTPGKWSKLVLETHREGNLVVYDAVTLSGVRTVLAANNKFTAPVLGFKTDAMNHAVQLDANGNSTPFTLFVDNIRFTISQR